MGRTHCSEDRWGQVTDLVDSPEGSTVTAIGSCARARRLPGSPRGPLSFTGLSHHLTSNKSYGDCGSIFGDSIIATAILDRLLHHSATINIRGQSYRLKDRRRAGLVPPRGQEGVAAPTSLASGLRSAQNAPKDDAGLRSVRGQGGQ